MQIVNLSSFFQRSFNQRAITSLPHMKYIEKMKVKKCAMEDCLNKRKPNWNILNIISCNVNKHLRSHNSDTSSSLSKKKKKSHLSMDTKVFLF